jgi:RimJ/RimL family protein N-acetyltransferase
MTFFLQRDELGLARCEPEAHELEMLTEWCNDEDVTRYMFTGVTPMTPGEVTPLHKWTGNQHVFACYLRAESIFLGTAGLYTIQQTHRTAEFRIFIGADHYWGLGYGTLATKLVLEYAFERLNLHCVFLGVNEEHKRARKLYERVGFLREGVLREQFWRNGRYYNLIRMSMLEDEYRKVRGQWNSRQA